jgi:hypothetical protein
MEFVEKLFMFIASFLLKTMLNEAVDFRINQCVKLYWALTQPY